MNDAKEKRVLKIRAKLKRSKLPRLSVYKSLSHVYAMIICRDGTVLASASSLSKDFKKKFSAQKLTRSELAYKVGEMIASRALKKDIKKVVFDRSGFPYHGIVKILADTARKKGLEF